MFTLRNKELYDIHVSTAKCDAKPRCGVKRQQVFSANLFYFNVCTGYPPDVAHDILEGILPVELAYCLNLFIAKRYFTLDILNELILTFAYKSINKRNLPMAFLRLL